MRKLPDKNLCSIREKTSLFACIITGLFFFTGCFPGGIYDIGGYSDHAGIHPSATLAGGFYRIVCLDKNEVQRRNELESTGAEIPSEPPVRYIEPEDYDGGCEVMGETSQFYLFHAFPVTPALNPEYAMSLPVQEYEGDTMINIRSWHETHYYSILGRVSVFKVKGDVIRFLSPQEIQERQQRR